MAAERRREAARYNVSPYPRTLKCDDPQTQIRAISALFAQG